MRTTLKIILIAVAFMVLVLIVGVSKAFSGSKNGAGPLGIVFMVAFLAGARAIWKYNPEGNSKDVSSKPESDDQTPKLDKS